MNDYAEHLSNREWIRRAAPGLLLSLGLAVVAFVTWWLLKDTWFKFSALLWAFIFSIVAVNILPVLSTERFKSGIDFSSTRLCRFAVALLGLTVSAAVWVELGGIGILVVIINLVFAFVFGSLFCRYVLKLDASLAVLIGMGTSICGASAIAATGPALKAKAEEMGLSVAVITLFGLIAMLLYPFLYNGPLNQWLHDFPPAFGMWVGMGIHETAQVIAAGSQVDGASSIAISAKFIRISMIGPMVFASLFVFRRFSGKSSAGQIKWSVPWFAVAFIALTLVHLVLASLPIRDWWAAFNGGYLKPGVTFLLAWAFAGIGLQVRAASIRSIGLKAFLGGIVVALFAGGSALLLVKYVWLPFFG